MEKEKGGGGFLAGLIVGAAVGALISTKRGRQILKDLSDYGLEYMGKAVNFDDFDAILNEEEEDISTYAKPSEEKMNGEAEVTKEAESSMETSEHSRRKRLFKGIKK